MPMIRTLGALQAARTSGTNMRPRSLRCRSPLSGGFEVGCSVGILKRQLAQVCQSLLAIDVAERALQTGEANLGRHK